jgi:hypothetical protein
LPIFNFRSILFDPGMPRDHRLSIEVSHHRKALAPGGRRRRAAQTHPGGSSLYRSAAGAAAFVGSSAMPIVPIFRVLFPAGPIDARQ